MFLYIAVAYLVIIPDQGKSQDKVDAATKIRLQKLVELDPENIKSHQAFINAWKIDDPNLIDQYDKWISRYPKSSGIPLAIGTALIAKENPKAKPYLLKAVELNPGLAEAWYGLYIDASFRGENSLAGKYLKNASNADPANLSYAMYYAYFIRENDPFACDSLMLRIIRQHPNSAEAVSALNALADNAVGSEKKAYYELLYSKYVGSNNPARIYGMTVYYTSLLDTEPEKAFDLALKMFLEVKENWGPWNNRVLVAKRVMLARKLMDDNKPREAYDLLKLVNLSKRGSLDFVNAEELLALLKAEAADAADMTQTAFDSLAHFYSNQPSDRLRSFLLSYGTKLNKDSLSVFQEINRLRIQRSPPATPLSLSSYYNLKDTIKLSDFKGKVVLLTYWFPGCGPCRAEFPHFEEVLKKFNTDEIAYVGINGDITQDDYVLPFMKASGFSFIPLRGSIAPVGNLGASGYPTNYLIDKSGRIIWSKFRVDKTNHRMFELYLSEVMKQDSL